MGMMVARGAVTMALLAMTVVGGTGIYLIILIQHSPGALKAPGLCDMDDNVCGSPLKNGR